MEKHKAVKKLQDAVKAYHSSGFRKNIADHEMDEALKMATETIGIYDIKPPIVLLSGVDTQSVTLCGNCEQEIEPYWIGCPFCLTIVKGD